MQLPFCVTFFWFKIYIFSPVIVVPTALFLYKSFFLTSPSLLQRVDNINSGEEQVPGRESITDGFL